MNIFDVKNIKFHILIISLIFLNINYKNIYKGGSNNFTIFKKVNLDNKLLVSTSLFIKKNINLENNKYIKGLDKLYNWCLKNNYVLRIYFDESSYVYIKEKYLNKSNIELYKYFFPKFYLKNEKIHYGTFGTFARFYPLFNIKNHYHNHVLIADCDFDKRLEISYIQLINFINNHKKLHNNMLISKSRFCYADYNRFKNVYNKEFPFMAGCMYSYNNNFNICILENYIKNLKLDNTIYGCDEHFINTDFFKTLKKNNVFVLLDRFCFLNIKNYNSSSKKYTMYYKCYNIFHEYIKNIKKDIEITNLKQTNSNINNIKKIYKLNKQEILYIKCIYYNYYYKKKYNNIVNKFYFVDNKLYNFLYKTIDKNNNIKYYNKTINNIK